MHKFIIKKFLIAIFSMMLLTSCKKTETGDIIVSNINIVDVKNGLLIKQQDVIISGNRIKKIIPHDRFNLKSNVILEGSGKFLIPGLWDMHTHMRSYSGSDNLPMFIFYGVTGIRDLGLTNHKLIKHWKSQIEQNVIIGPRIISSGSIIEGSDPSFKSSIVINKLEDVEPVLDSLIAQDIQVVKLFHTIPSEVFKDIIRYSKKRGIVTSGHIPDDMNQITAAQAGLNSIEHLYGIWNTLSNYNNLDFSADEIENLAQVLIENNIYQTPTLVSEEYYSKLGQASKNRKTEQLLFETNQYLELTPKYFNSWWSMLKEQHMQNLTDDDYLQARSSFEFMREITVKLNDLGVKILAGTDVPNPYVITGISLHNELEHFVNGGMSPSDALKTATLYPAQYFNRSDELGSIDENYIADLVVLDANPLENISNTKRIHSVIYNGRLLTQENLRTIKADQLQSLAEYSEDDFDQFIYMDVRRNGVDSVRRKYADIDRSNANAKYKIESYHLVRLSKALKEGFQFEEAKKALEWNLELFPEDEITKALLLEQRN
ncbi:amidohydrolase family protein [Robertkochia solimangrovi]|uniref:amidohydrolase family protein n=1 Tax=Robertkochia solimangrovi TaxID=2213046 RepID=UPI0013A5BC08|nr:amidohydrolase family protein [Robertkochia solimangrovi]